MFQKNIFFKNCFKKYLKNFNKYVEKSLQKIKNISNGLIAFKNITRRKNIPERNV